MEQPRLDEMTGEGRRRFFPRSGQLPSSEATLDISPEGILHERPDLADLIRLCAIPHSFNADIVGALRGAPDDRQENERLLAELVAYPALVRSRDGSWYYPQGVRAELLAWWRSSEHLARYQQVSAELARFFCPKAQIDSLVRQLHLGSWQPTAESYDLLDRAIESAYHRLVADPEGGMEQARELFWGLDQADEYEACSWLMEMVVEQGAAFAKRPQAWLSLLYCFELALKLAHTASDALSSTIVCFRPVHVREVYLERECWAVGSLGISGRDVLEEAAHEGTPVLLRGVAGSGKTFELYHLADLCLRAKSERGEAQRFQRWRGDTLPLLIDLPSAWPYLELTRTPIEWSRALVQYLVDGVEHLPASLHDSLRTMLSGRLLQGRGCLWLIDGLDSLPDAAFGRCLEWLRALLAKYDAFAKINTGMVIAYRSWSSEEQVSDARGAAWGNRSPQAMHARMVRRLPGIVAHELRPIHDEDVKELHRRWQAALLDPPPSDEEQWSRAEEFAVRLAVQPHLWEAIREPSLAVLAIFYDIQYRDKRPLPASRVKLYNTYWREPLIRAGQTLPEAEAKLPALAYHALLTQTSEITRDHIGTWLNLPPADVAALMAQLQTMGELCYVIEYDPGHNALSFTREAFRQFLAAKHVAQMERAEQRRFFSQELGNPRFYEVLLQAVTHLALIDEDIEALADLLFSLCQERPRGIALEWFAEAVADSRAIEYSDERLRTVTAIIREALVASIEANRERGDWADVWRLAVHLGQIGDPRLEDALVEVPAGVAHLGLSSSALASLSRQGQEMALRMGENKEAEEFVPGFWIDKYPVTNAQFLEFVEQTGYEPRPSHWLGGHVHPWERNCPVVNISWEAAMAYAAWRSERTGWRVTLPTEAQWMRALRGDSWALWPWPDSRSDPILNLSDSVVWASGKIAPPRRPSPVGIFPDAKGRFVPLEDAAGNVRLWLWNAYEHHEDYRVIQGSSFLSVREDARCTRRWRGYRKAFFPDVGFRCVALPPGGGVTSSSRRYFALPPVPVDSAPCPDAGL